MGRAIDSLFTYQSCSDEKSILVGNLHVVAREELLHLRLSSRVRKISDV